MATASGPAPRASLNAVATWEASRSMSRPNSAGTAATWGIDACVVALSSASH
jgi:hypothetical protein